MTHVTYSSGETSARLSPCWLTYLGSIHGVLNAAKLTDLSYSEMAGMTGMAFHFIIHKNCDVASPTVYDWVGRHMNALERIGVLSEVYHYEPWAKTYEAARARAEVHIKQSIDRGIGVIAWAIDMGEFGIIYGYDDEDGVYLVDGVEKFMRPLGSDPMLYDNLAKKFPPAPFLHYQIPIASVDYDRKQVYRDSLQFYVDEMEKDAHLPSDFQTGFKAYDNWIQSLTEGTYQAFGLRYMVSVYSELKTCAASYTRKLAETWQECNGIREVADRFEALSGIYRVIEQEVLEQTYSDNQHLGKPVSKSQAEQLIPLVERAKALEVETVQLVKQALAHS
ncbi:BtrH N-terminal domain-containing protein [Paenibacillus sp. N1-5-1-14]|uniref:BtrH N-terminal domain-containing protein n=1 Tax=Paenibacillus radicibacter TaxID=2972488 RepID=UPI0021590699|nr:BtrH N-terminal domain-containing protein [Paenibacillus radicibacter]MCR8643499.1 BtrH N-terminal domain-containing protein [Paenibacillus radicibacter]